MQNKKGENMKLLVTFIFVIVIDFTVIALYRSTKKEDKELERPNSIKIRSKK